MSKILHLTLKKKWFDLISSGEKKEEYREIGKENEFWEKRLLKCFKETKVTHECRKATCHACLTRADGGRFKTFDKVRFRNGYRPDSPTCELEVKGIRIGEGKEEWGAEPGKQYFVITLGEIRS